MKENQIKELVMQPASAGPNVPSAPGPPESENAPGAASGDSAALGCGSGAAPGSPSSKKAYAYLYDKDTKEIRGSIEFESHYLDGLYGRIDMYSHIPNALIKKYGGIGANEKIRVTRLTQQELRSEWANQPRPAHR